MKVMHDFDCYGRSRTFGLFQSVIDEYLLVFIYLFSLTSHMTFQPAFAETLKTVKNERKHFPCVK